MSWLGTIRFGTALLCVWSSVALSAETFTCAVCDLPIGDVVIFSNDKVAGGKKKPVCLECLRLPRTCYLCGMPVKKDFTELSDQRALCARDAKSVVLDETEGVDIAKQVKASLDRLFSRFTTFTDHVKLRLADRVDIMNLYHVPGNDFLCPDVRGYTDCVTNGANVGYVISLLSGMTASELRSTTAHEWSHTWIFENVSAERQKRLHPDAREGFCELVSHLFVESQDDKTQLGMIRSNAYTRGQILLFIEAERRFGFNEIVDWMKFGVDPRLKPDALERVREVELPVPTNAVPVTYVSPAPAIPLNEVTLQGVTWSKTRPLALINGRTFSVNEEAKVPVGSSNVVVRCVAIREGAVVVWVGGATAARTLQLRRN